MASVFVSWAAGCHTARARASGGEAWLADWLEVECQVPYASSQEYGLRAMSQDPKGIKRPAGRGAAGRRRRVIGGARLESCLSGRYGALPRLSARPPLRRALAAKGPSSTYVYHALDFAAAKSERRASQGREMRGRRLEVKHRVRRANKVNRRRAA